MIGMRNPPTGFSDDPHQIGVPGAGAATAGPNFQQITGDKQPCLAVCLQLTIAATDGVLVGDATTGCRAIEPGESLWLSIDNANKVYVKRAGSSDQTVNWAVVRR